MIRVLLADSDSEYLEVLCSMLSEVPEFSIIGAVTTGAKLLDFVNNCEVDLVLVEYDLPDIKSLKIQKQINKSNYGKDTQVLLAFISNKYAIIEGVKESSPLSFLSANKDMMALKTGMLRLAKQKRIISFNPSTLV